jgi:hypothetical protein
MSDVMKAGENNHLPPSPLNPLGVLGGGGVGKTGENHPMFGKCRAEGAGRPSQAIEVLDLNTNQTTTYESIREAARALNINRSIISIYFANNQQKPYKGIYAFKKL